MNTWITIDFKSNQPTMITKILNSWLQFCWFLLQFIRMGNIKKVSSWLSFLLNCSIHNSCIFNVFWYSKPPWTLDIKYNNLCSFCILSLISILTALQNMGYIFKECNIITKLRMGSPTRKFEITLSLFLFFTSNYFFITFIHYIQSFRHKCLHQCFAIVAT